ncbi:MAG: methyltransferase domain-containing protein [Myxococcales bacterium]|nr:methyltransferase domain-containing protein [Myxococcales bacterium]
MDVSEFRRFGHRQRWINTPIDRRGLDEVLARLPVQPGSKVCDLGCGTGAWLRALVDSGFEGACEGVDSDDLAIDEAVRLSEKYPSIRWQVGEGEAYLASASGLGGVFCVGSSHALGGFQSALSAIGGALSSGAWALVGEGFWENEPCEQYRSFLGGDLGLMSHAENVAAVESQGFDCLWATTATTRHWDDFEWDFYRVARDWARENPQDIEASSTLEKRTAWRNAYLEWGRGTMGFGYYLLRKP